MASMMDRISELSVSVHELAAQRKVLQSAVATATGNPEVPSLKAASEALGAPNGLTKEVYLKIVEYWQMMQKEDWDKDL